MNTPVFYSAGDGAITVSFGNAIDPELNERVFQLYNALVRRPDKFWKDIIPAYASLTLVYDSVSIVRNKKQPAHQFVRSYVLDVLSKGTTLTDTRSRNVTIPVCYDPEVALDLSMLSKKSKLSADDIVSIHTSTSYRVYMLGFLPGFAYMGSVDKRIAFPRLEKPRTLVPAGSVGIAGEQTGVYPLGSPGGWNIIGRTAVKLFDKAREEPTLLRPGDVVTFKPVFSLEEPYE